MSQDVTIRGQIHSTAPGKILFSTNGDQTEAQWLPSDQMDIGRLRHGVGLIRMPAQLAEEWGLA